ncbi:hypothetical protein [Photobacterium leiognathi]|uniref:hypothetical protein n=1 Tax=Photobacterium leiognathi TaxID=553611 RepID=UPI0029826C3B|nr:hypothetical protein [Photobacterium leiognathi]
MPRQRKLLNIGDRYGRLVVKEHINSKIGVRTRSIFKCDCGSIVTKDNYNVKIGKILSCGCYQKESASNTGSKLKYDMIGQSYGKWKALLRVSYKNGMNTPISYLCRCECGTIRIVTAHNLRDGKSKSCGKCR